MAKINFTKKQESLLYSQADVILFGGARGGGKSLGTVASTALYVVEKYTEVEIVKKGIDIRSFRRSTSGMYYKFVIDYPDYQAVLVRRTEKQLFANTLVECRKIFKDFGANWIKQDMKWTFPSGAEVFLKSCNKEEHLDFFRGPNFHTLVIEELTQFSQFFIEEMEACCRSAHKFIPARKIYTSNPGGRGHSYVKNRFVDKCLPVDDGDPVTFAEAYRNACGNPKAKVPQIFEEETFQPQKANDIYINEAGEKLLYIPATVFDNQYLLQDIKYVSNFVGKGRIYKEMYLYGNWAIFAGQVFDNWREDIHTADELIFFGAKDYTELITKKLTFDWTDYRLYRSYDYGYRDPFVCVAFAVHNETNKIIEFAEIVERELTAKKQAELVNSYFLENYNLQNDDFSLDIADPAMWNRQDREDEFKSPQEDYLDYNIVLTKANNDRISGLNAVRNSFQIKKSEETGKQYAQFQCLDCCGETMMSIPALPYEQSKGEKKNEDVDTHANDHVYDAIRYFILKFIGNFTKIENNTKKKTNWREKLRKNYYENIDNAGWKAS